MRITRGLLAAVALLPLLCGAVSVPKTCDTALGCIDLTPTADSLAIAAVGHGRTDALLPLLVGVFSDSPRNLVVEVATLQGVGGVACRTPLGISHVLGVRTSDRPVSVAVHLPRSCDRIKQFLDGDTASAEVTVRAWLTKDDPNSSASPIAVDEKTIRITHPTLKETAPQLSFSKPEADEFGSGLRRIFSPLFKRQTRTCDTIHAAYLAGTPMTSQDYTDWANWQCSTWFPGGIGAVTRTCDSIFAAYSSGVAMTSQDYADWSSWKCSTWFPSGIGSPGATSSTRSSSSTRTSSSTRAASSTTSTRTTTTSPRASSSSSSRTTSSSTTTRASSSPSPSPTTTSRTTTSRTTSSPRSTTTSTRTTTTSPASPSSPCTGGGTGGCIDPSSLPTSVPASAGLGSGYTISVRAWAPTQKDLFVEFRKNGVIVSNYAYASLPAASGSGWTTVSVTLTFPTQTVDGTYTFFVWLTAPGASWGGQTFNTLITTALSGGTTPPPPPPPPSGGSRSAAGAYISSCKTPGTYALTFDDGPYIYTAGLKSILASYGIKATFFVNGNNWGSIYNYQALLQDSVAQGHQIAMHGWSHCDFTVPSTCIYANEVDQLMSAIQSILGRTPTYFRFPYGSYDSAAQNYVAGKGLRIVGWNLDTGDWQDANKANPSITLATIQNALNAVSSTYSSFIALEHDVWPTTAGATSNSWIWAGISFIQSKGYHFVTVAECDGDASGGYR